MSHQPIEPGTKLDDLDSLAVQRLIPHRYPMLLVDRVVDMLAFQSATGIKNVTSNEPFFPGHFPGDPIMPGVLIVEAMAQCAAVLAVASSGAGAAGTMVYFTSVDHARFRRPVRPGDSLRLHVRLLRHKLALWKFEGRAEVDQQLATEAAFSAKVVGSPPAS